MQEPLFHYFFNMGHLYIHACLKMQLCLKMRFSTAFGDTLKKRYSKIHEVWPRCNGMEWKMPFWGWHTFWMAPWLICCVIFWRESDFFQRKLAAILPLKSKLSENFHVSMLLMKVSKCIQIVSYPNNCLSPKISITMKNFKTLYKPQKASHIMETIR